MTLHDEKPCCANGDVGRKRKIDAKEKKGVSCEEGIQGEGSKEETNNQPIVRIEINN